MVICDEANGSIDSADIHKIITEEIVNGRCWSNFASRIITSRLAPARPRAIGWNVAVAG